jgi:transposase-like protein
MGKRFSNEERAAVLQRWNISGLRLAPICRQEQLCYQSVLRWRRARLGQGKDVGKAPFLKVECAHLCVVSVQPCLQAELALPLGMVLRVFTGT